MNTKAITLNSGHVVTIKTALTYRAQRAITSTLLGDTPIKVTPGDKDSLKERELEVRYQNFEAYQDAALGNLVVSVLNPDKTEAADPYEAIMDLPADDGQAVMDAIYDLIGSKKK